MASKWQVEYTFSSEVRIEESGPKAYPALGVTVETGDGVLKKIAHTITFPDTPSENEAKDRSGALLATLFAGLRYWHLKPLPYWVHATRLEPPESTSRVRLQASGTIGPRLVRTPPVGWDTGAPPQLASWLLLASEGQETPSPSASIRFYFVILEELASLNDPFATAKASDIKDVKAVRDFVSHPRITGATTIATLSACAPGLADSAGAFAQDPTSQKQTTILNEWRQKARALVAAYLDQWLPIK